MRKIYAIIAMMLLAVCPKAMAEETASEKVIAWSAPANYNSPVLEQNFAVTIVAYTDGTYAIKGVYGSEYDLEFTVDNESVINGKPEIVFTMPTQCKLPIIISLLEIIKSALTMPRELDILLGKATLRLLEFGSTIIYTREITTSVQAMTS